jgi:hypothetical protein
MALNVLLSIVFLSSHIGGYGGCWQPFKQELIPADVCSQEGTGQGFSEKRQSAGRQRTGLGVSAEGATGLKVRKAEIPQIDTEIAEKGRFRTESN